CIAHESRTEGWIAIRWAGRQLYVGAEAGIVLVVILFDNEAAVTELRLEVEAVWGSAWIESANEWVPVSAVGMDRPNSPQDVAAPALRFERAIHDAAVLENDGVQRAGDIQMADLLEIGGRVVVADVGVAVIHDEELQGDGRIAAGGAEAVAIAGENELAAGQ